MKFTSLDDLVAYLHHENKKISDLEFSCKSDDDKAADKKTEKKLDEDLVPENMPYDAKNTIGSITSLHGSPNIVVEKSDGPNVLFVKDFTSIPNSCHMGKIELLGREIYAGICTEGKQSKIELTVETTDNYGNKKIITDTFTLQQTGPNTSEKIMLNNRE